VAGLAILPTSQFFVSTFLAAVPLFVATSPSRREILFATTGAAFFCFEAVLLHRFGINRFIVSLGMGAIVGMFCRKPDITVNSIIAISLPVGIFAIAAISLPMCALTPHTIDAQLQSIDFGVAAAFRHAAVSVAPFGLAMYLVYVNLPLAMSFVIVFSPERDRLKIGGILALAAICALPFYLLFPAVGPSHLNHPGSPRNCMPSLHLTWALLLVALSERRWLRYTMACFAALTAVATLTTGEHYVIDLIAAVPFTFCVLWLSRQSARFTKRKATISRHQQKVLQ
jgi:hypothetical protein